MKKLVFKKWRFYKMPIWKFLYMWLTPSWKWEDEEGTHYSKKCGKETHFENIRIPQWTIKN